MGNDMTKRRLHGVKRTIDTQKSEIRIRSRGKTLDGAANITGTEGRLETAVDC